MRSKEVIIPKYPVSWNAKHFTVVETSLKFWHTTRRQIPDGSVVHKHRYKNLKHHT